MDKGIIGTSCVNCHVMQKVEVIFPAWNKGFNDQPYTCSECGQEQIVYDTNTYNEDGTITPYDYGMDETA